MVALVSKETDLRRAGTRWTGLCPFHEERTPSFSVNAEEKLYHCFGCQKGGDAIGFVMETEGLDFPEAVEALADRFGVELKREREDPEEEERRKRRERLLALLERTTGFYVDLPVGGAGGQAGARLPRRAGAGGGGAARLPRRLRAQGLGPRAHRRAAGRLLRGRAARQRASRMQGPQRQPARPLPRADHVPAGGQPRPGAGLRRAGHARRAGREVHQHGRERDLQEGPPAVRDRPRAGGDRQGRACRGGGGLHRRAGAARRRRRGGRGHHGHGRDPGAGRRARPLRWAPRARCR